MNVDNIVTNNEHLFEYYIRAVKGDKVFVESENSMSYLHEGTFHGTKLVDGIMKACVEWLNHANKFEWVLLDNIVQIHTPELLYYFRSKPGGV